jgi:hypothetical protein
MADATTVLEFATQQNGSLKTGLAVANSNLNDARNALHAAAKSRDDARAALDATTKDIAAVRSQLATAVSPEDAQALLKQLQADIAASRGQIGNLAQKELAVAVAKANADVGASEVQRLTAALAASNSALQDATIQDKTRAGLKAALNSAPLSTIAADAKAVADGTAWVDPAQKFKSTDALNRLKSDLTDSPIQDAEHRLQDEVTRANASSGEALQAQLLVENEWKSDGGLSGAVQAAQSAFQRAQTALATYVATANSRLQQAKTWLAKVADPTHSPLTAAQLAAIHDPTALANAAGATAAEQAVDDSAAALAQAQAALDEKLREDLAAGLDSSDPSAAVTSATKARDDAQTKLTAAQAAYTDALKSKITAWEVLVPDSEWQLLWTYENALATLNWLQTPGPAQLAADMDAAELALVKALAAADKGANIAAALRAEAMRQVPIANFESTVAPGRRLSALRGDF